MKYYNYKVLILPLLLISILLISGCVTEGVLKAKFSNLPQWTMGQNGVFPLTVEGGTPPYACAITNGALPQGFVLANCEIDGTPPLLAGGTTQSISPPFTITITDSANPPNTLAVEMAIVVKQPSLTLVTNPVACIVGQYCSANLIANVTGGTPPYHYQSDTFRNGTPPWGTVVGTDGLLIGIPTREGTYTFGVCAVDTVALSKCEPVTAIIEPAEEPGIVLQTGTATCTVDEQCDADLILDVSGGISPYEFELGEGTAPFGTTLDIDGFLTGVPTLEGTYTFEVCAVDSASASACEETTVTIEPPAELGTTYSGPFSISGNYDRAFPDYYTTCTFADDFTGTITLYLTEDAEGTVSGTADVEGTFISNAIAGSTADFTCLSSEVPWSDSASVSGTTSSLQFDTVFITAGGSTYTGDFIGSVYADSVTGDMEFTSPCCTGSASNSVTLAKE